MQAPPHFLVYDERMPREWPGMVAEGRGRIWRRKDGKYFIYLPKHLAEDSAFPFKTKTSIPVKVIIDHKEKKLLIKPIAHKKQT